MVNCHLRCEQSPKTALAKLEARGPQAKTLFFLPIGEALPIGRSDYFYALKFWGENEALMIMLPL